MHSLLITLLLSMAVWEYAESYVDRARNVEYRVQDLSDRVDTENTLIEQRLSVLGSAVRDINVSIVALSNRSCFKCEEEFQRLKLNLDNGILFNGNFEEVDIDNNLLVRAAQDVEDGMKELEKYVESNMEEIRSKMTEYELLAKNLEAEFHQQQLEIEELKTIDDNNERMIKEQQAEIKRLENLVKETIETFEKACESDQHSSTEAVTSSPITEAVTGKTTTLTTKAATTMAPRNKGRDRKLPNCTSEEGGRNRRCCPDGWYYFERFCYYYDQSIKKTFDEARNLCAKSEAFIADFERRNESDFIRRLMGRKVDMWVGITDINEEGVWISEVTKEEVTNTNWLKGDPDGRKSQNCGQAGYRLKQWHKWIDDECSDTHHFVCKRRLVE